METRERYEWAYRAAREAMRESRQRQGPFSVVVCGVVEVNVVQARDVDLTIVRCDGEMGEAVARTLRGRGVAAFVG